MTRLTERARLERRIADLKEREANISDRIARTKLGQDLADVQLLIERAAARLSEMPTETPPTEPGATGTEGTGNGGEGGGTLGSQDRPAPEAASSQSAERAGPPTPRAPNRDDAGPIPSFLVRSKTAA